MASPFRLECHSFGGENYADEPTALIQRSHVLTQTGFVQQAPMECKSARNMDFRPSAIIKRLGSTLLNNLVSVMVASDSLIDGYEFVTTGGTRTILILSVKTIYYSQDGGATFAQIGASGGGAYAHAANVSKGSFCALDGRCFIGVDGANKIQIFRTGTALDPSYTVGNNYPDTYGGGTSIVGPAGATIGTGYYIVFGFQNRLCMGTGDSVIEYSDIDEPWDRTGGGFWQTKGKIIACKTFTRRTGNELSEVLYFNTEQGGQFVTGFDVNDAVINVAGTTPTLNHRCIVASNEWLMYPTLNKGVEGVNLNSVIDLGRRFKTRDGTTGPLDTISLSNSQADAFGFWNEDKKQPQWWFDDGTNSTTSHALVLDLYLGEPIPGEPKELFEKRVRCLTWSIKSPPWFVGVFQARGQVIGVMADGNLYVLESGIDDLASQAVEEYWQSGDIQPALGRSMTWRDFRPRFSQNGNWNVNGSFFVNQDIASPYDPIAFLQLNTGTAIYDTATYDVDSYATSVVVRGLHWVDLYGESLSIKLYNQATQQDWGLQGFSQGWVLGAEEV